MKVTFDKHDLAVAATILPSNIVLNENGMMVNIGNNFLCVSEIEIPINFTASLTVNEKKLTVPVKAFVSLSGAEIEANPSIEG